MKKTLDSEMEKFHQTRSRIVLMALLVSLLSLVSAKELFEKNGSFWIAAALFLAAIQMSVAAVSTAMILRSKKIAYPAFRGEGLLQAVSLKTEQMRILFQFPLLFCCIVWAFALPKVVSAATSMDALLLSAFIAIAFAEEALTGVLSFGMFMAVLTWSVVTGRNFLSENTDE